VVVALLWGQLAWAAPLVLDAGGLRAEVATDPWRLRFVQADGGAALDEAADGGLSPAGPIGFRTAAGWWHATRIASSHARRAAVRPVGETPDPLGSALDVELRLDVEGVIALTASVVGGPVADVQALGVGFEAHDGERFFGFGERADAVDQRGQVVENYVADGPYQPDERTLIAAFVPKPGFRARDDATYFPVPWLLS